MPRKEVWIFFFRNDAYSFPDFWIFFQDSRIGVNKKNSVIWVKSCPIFALSKKKGLSPEIIKLSQNASLISVVWNRHAKLILLGHYKNLWAKIFEKIVKKSQILAKKPL